MKIQPLKVLMITSFILSALSLMSQGETEFYSDGIIIPRVDSNSITNPSLGMLIYETTSNNLAVYNGTKWLIPGSNNNNSLWSPTNNGITYDNTGNVGVGASAIPGTTMFIQGDFDEDPFRVQIGRMDNPDQGSTKFRILAKFNAMTLGTSGNSIDSTNLNSLWSNYLKHYIRDSLCIGNPDLQASVVLDRASGIATYDSNGDETFQVDHETGLARILDMSVTEQASFGKGLISSDPIRLREVGNGPAGPQIQFMDDNSTTNVAASIKVTNSTGNGNNHNMLITNNSSAGNISFQFNNTPVIRILDNVIMPALNGSVDLGTSNNRWGTVYAQNNLNTSDLKLKKNVHKMTEEILPQLLQLRPTTYQFKSQEDHSKKSIGFIAQEVEKINPDWVIAPENEDGYYLVNYDNFSVLAIKAIQEQQKLINELSTELEEVKTTLKLMSEK